MVGSVAADSWNLIVNENDTGGYAAFVTTAQYGDGTADVIDMQLTFQTLPLLILNQLPQLTVQSPMKWFI